MNEWLNSRAVTIADTFRALFVLVWTFDGGTSETGSLCVKSLSPLRETEIGAKADDASR